MNWIAAFLLTFAFLALPAHAGTDTLNYKSGLVDSLIAKGQTVLVDFSAEW